MTVVRQISWITFAFGIQQFVRLGTNVVLAMLVTPSVFGVMLILNTLRTGVEQITDVGIGQNIVFDPQGNRPRFYNTAWTIQIVRGVVLFIAFLAISPLLNATFGDNQLDGLLPIFAVIFLITGFASPSLFLLQKNLQVAKQVKIELATAIVGGVLAIAFAMQSPTAISLVYALLLSTFIGALIAASVMNWRNLRITIDVVMAKRIVFYGKWVFLSSLLYFAATSFDRLYFAAVIPLSILGIFGIAKTFSDAAFQLAHKVAMLIVFPTVAEKKRTGDGTSSMAQGRKSGTLVAGMIMGAGLAVSDQVIFVLYDDRYAAAAFILPLILFGTWFAILAVINESVAFGSGNPAQTAGANGLKFAWLITSVPLAFTEFGFVPALYMIALSDIPRYVFLAAVSTENRGRYLRQDLIATAAMLAVAIVARGTLVALGWIDGIIPSIPPELLST